MKNVVMGRSLPMAGKVQDSAPPEYVTAETLLREAEMLLMERFSGRALSSPMEMKALLIARLAALQVEEFHVVFLDTQHRVIAIEAMFQGDIDGCSVPVRPIAIAALKHGAASVCLAHNHPSGNPEPSCQDRAATRTIKAGLSALDVRVLDHIIVGGFKATSMAERGWV